MNTTTDIKERQNSEIKTDELTDRNTEERKVRYTDKTLFRSFFIPVP